MNKQQQIEMQKRNPNIFDAIPLTQHISREMKIITFMFSFLFFAGLTLLVRSTYIQGESKFLMTSFETLVVIMGIATIIQIGMWIMEGKPSQKKQ